MRRRITLALLLLVSLVCVGFAQQAHERARWEYKVTCGRADLGALGEEGWELAAATQEGNITCLYFKRQK